MKKYIIPILLIAGSFLSSIEIARAQTTTAPEAVLKTFPYQQSNQASEALNSMDAWKSADWKMFFALMEDTSQQTKATYALHAFVNKVAQEDSKRAAFVKVLHKQIKKAKSDYTKILYVEELKLLSDTIYVNGRLSILPETKLGDHVIIGSGAIVETGAQIADFASIGAGSVIGKEAIIENNAYVGIHSTIVGSVKVGKSATVGAGSVVIENVAASKRVFGNPAKAL
jgi:acetyltransferase-like isoleucine patch superfamily enzyme